MLKQVFNNGSVLSFHSQKTGLLSMAKFRKQYFLRSFDFRFRAQNLKCANAIASLITPVFMVVFFRQLLRQALT